MEDNKTTFEEKMKRLEEIASILNQGNLQLEESLKLYNEGKQLIQELNIELEKIEGNIVKVI